MELQPIDLNMQYHGNLGVVGCRYYSGYEYLSIILDQFIQINGKPLNIVSGGAKGVDSLAARYALEKNIPLIEYHPDIGNGNINFATAAKARNTQIVNASHTIIAFPSSRSKGTWDTIRKAQQAAKYLYIYEI
jgi:hypothetical protein